jgi:hypothetical protein
MLPPKFALQKIYSLCCNASSVKLHVPQPEANTQEDKLNKYIKELGYRRELN